MAPVGSISLTLSSHLTKFQDAQTEALELYLLTKGQMLLGSLLRVPQGFEEHTRFNQGRKMSLLDDLAVLNYYYLVCILNRA